MRQVWIVMRREYLERVKTKGFILSTIALPVLMVGMIGLSAFLGIQSERSQRELALIDYTGLIGEEVASRVEAFGYEMEVIGADVGQEELDRQVMEDELEGYLVIDDLTVSEGVFAYRGKDRPGTLRASLFERIVVETALERHLSALDDAAPVRALIEGGELDFESVVESTDGEDAEVDRIAGIVAGFGGAFLLYFTMLLYGAYVLRSVLDEKRNRVVEVVISSITPWRLLLGKVLGVGSMGLTQLGIWFASAAVLAMFGVPFVVAQLQATELGGILQFLPGPGAIALLGGYFVLGYFLYASMFAAVGAMCSSEEEAQQAQFPVMMLLIIPFVLQMATIEGSGFAWMDWVALFPYFSPVMMFPRAVAGAVPWWMVTLSLVFMAVALVGTAWVAGRIYRVGILMQGKRPTLRELVRWIRTA